jgi:GNAT superfamily N-acetyltransferase
MKIRFAHKDDIPLVLDMGKAMIAESRFNHYETNETKTVTAITGMIVHPERACLLLAERTNGEVAGMLAGHVTDYFFCDAMVAQDRVFYVKPEHRGSSAAVKLLLAFRSWAANHGADELSINMSVGVDMARFNKFMAHLGFGCCGSNFSMSLKTHTERPRASSVA